MLVMLQDINKLKFLNKFNALWLDPFVIKEFFPNIFFQLQNLRKSNFLTHTNGGCYKEYKV
jgi:hypothetical protein